MRNTAADKTWLARLAPMAVAAFVTFAITSDALAGKPPKPPGDGTTPTYKYVSMSCTDPRAFNNAGQVAERIYPDPAIYEHPAIVIPEDTNADGMPDQWYRDSNGDGVNDLKGLSVGAAANGKA